MNITSTIIVSSHLFYVKLLTCITQRGINMWGLVGILKISHVDVLFEPI